MSKKQCLGQFYSEKATTMLSGMRPSCSANTKLIEPFVGNGDLARWAMPLSFSETYDLDPRTENAVVRDTLLNPPSYEGKYVITNPPYLYRNKSADKRAFDKFGEDDLYACFVRSIVLDPCVGGIVILPLNFLSAMTEKAARLREDFFTTFAVTKANIFEDQVFQDTKIPIVAVQFARRAFPLAGDAMIPCFFPVEGTCSVATIGPSNKWKIAGHLFALEQGDVKVSRGLNTRIVLKAVDDNKPISCFVLDAEADDNTTKSRAYAQLNVQPPLTDEEQVAVANRFNEIVVAEREKHHSLFLTAFRETKRKRISFKMAYAIVAAAAHEISRRKRKRGECDLT